MIRCLLLFALMGIVSGCISWGENTASYRCECNAQTLVQNRKLMLRQIVDGWHNVHFELTKNSIAHEIQLPSYVKDDATYHATETKVFEHVRYGIESVQVEVIAGTVVIDKKAKKIIVDISTKFGPWSGNDTYRLW